MTLRASLHWLITDWSILLVMTPYTEFLFQAPIASFLTTTASSRQNSRNQKIKQTTNTNIHNNQMLSVDMFLHVCVCENVRCPSLSHRHTPTRHMGGCRQTHTYTCKRTQARPSLPNPPSCLQSTASVPFAVRLSYLLGVGVLFVVWVRGARGERQMETRSEEKEEMEVAGWSSAGQRHCVDHLLQLAPQSLSPRLLVPLQSRQDL